MMIVLILLFALVGAVLVIIAKRKQRAFNDPDDILVGVQFCLGWIFLLFAVVLLLVWLAYLRAIGAI